MKKTSFNDNWYFYKDGEQDSILLCLPHDAMLSEKRQPNMENGAASGYFPGGKYHYKKTLKADKMLLNSAVILEFEGVYMDSTVLLNGSKVGGHYYGYTGFYVDLTDKLKEGDNEIEVIADNSLQPNSRWYSGSGIYRDVNLYVGEKDHLPLDGIKVKTLSISPAVIEVECEKEAEYEVSFKGKTVAKGSGKKTQITIPSAQLWSAESPNLYELNATYKKDSQNLKFGIRTISVDAKDGLKVNGKIVKLKGGCLHHDNGLLGACENKKAAYRKIKKLKSFGYNAVRYSHYPMSKAMLSACDEVGMYVLDETFDQWLIPQNKYDYSTHFTKEWQGDLLALVNKDYSHPSVILYCVGNEISDVGALKDASKTCKALYDYIKAIDDSRPIVLATNCLMPYLSLKIREMKENTVATSNSVNDIVAKLPAIMASLTADKTEELVGDSFNQVDVAGYNYTEQLYIPTHSFMPNRVMLASETFPAKIAKNWKLIEKLPYCIGDFMWTAWDYIGEAGVGVPFYNTKIAPFTKPYPCKLASCGSFDILGNPETQAYNSAIVFGAYDKPYISVRPLNHSGEDVNWGNWRLTDGIHSWSWDGCEGKQATVEVYGNGEEIELFINDKSVGKNKVENSKAVFNLPYIPGKLKAVMYNNGKKVSVDEIESAKSKTVLTVEAEENTIKPGEITWINIAITDEKGIVKPLCDKKIEVSVKGGQLKGLGSANPVSEESFLSNSCTTHLGRAQAIVLAKEKGNIVVNIACDDLNKEVVIKVK